MNKTASPLRIWLNDFSSDKSYFRFGAKPANDGNRPEVVFACPIYLVLLYKHLRGSM